MGYALGGPPQMARALGSYMQSMHHATRQFLRRDCLVMVCFSTHMPSWPCAMGDHPMRIHPHTGESDEPVGGLVNEADAVPGVDVAVAHTSETGAAPREVHFADQHPLTAGIDRDDAAIVA